MLTSTDKLNSFKSKLEQWEEEVKKGLLKCFQELNVIILILRFWGTSKLIFKCWVINFYIISLCLVLTNMFGFVIHFLFQSWQQFSNLSVKQKELLDIINDRTLELKFKEMKLDEFWLLTRSEYPIISNQALIVLLPFSTSYLCELSFSAIFHIKNKKRSCLKSLDDELRVSSCFTLKM